MARYEAGPGMTAEEATAARGRDSDDMAFNAMKKGTSRPSDRLFEGDRIFTESEYNMNATHEERMDYDFKAYRFLQDLFQEDQAKNPDIKDWDFDRYLDNVSSSYLEEKFIHSREGDPDFYSKAGDMLRSVYSDDVGQLKLSAKNFKGDIPSRMGKDRSRANVSIKAPGAESY